MSGPSPGTRWSATGEGAADPSARCGYDQALDEGHGVGRPHPGREPIVQGAIDGRVSDCRHRAHGTGAADEAIPCRESDRERSRGVSPTIRVREATPVAVVWTVNAPASADWQPVISPLVGSTPAPASLGRRLEGRSHLVTPDSVAHCVENLRLLPDRPRPRPRPKAPGFLVVRITRHADRGARLRRRRTLCREDFVPTRGPR
jgi:hypothetical protein